jgi:hypothetical protein
VSAEGTLLIGPAVERRLPLLRDAGVRVREIAVHPLLARGDGPAMLERLRSAGSWVRDTATSIGAPVVTAALKAAFGLA